MKIQSFQKMQAEYLTTSRGLEVEDLEERKKILERYRFSVIVEGNYDELSNLQKWIEQNLNKEIYDYIYYGKTEYDYGFVEYFVSEKEQEVKLKSIVPNIFTTHTTTYPDGYPTMVICKSDGYGINIKYESSHKDGIVFPEEEF